VKFKEPKYVHINSIIICDVAKNKVDESWYGLTIEGNNTIKDSLYKICIKTMKLTMWHNFVLPTI
jgi:hypothetical protein